MCNGNGCVFNLWFMHVPEMEELEEKYRDKRDV